MHLFESIKNHYKIIPNITDTDLKKERAEKEAIFIVEIYQEQMKFLQLIEKMIKKQKIWMLISNLLWIPNKIKTTKQCMKKEEGPIQWKMDIKSGK